MASTLSMPMSCRRDGTPGLSRRGGGGAAGAGVGSDENTNTSQIFSYLEKQSVSPPGYSGFVWLYETY
jgi:hypothetical protein